MKSRTQPDPSFPFVGPPADACCLTRLPVRGGWRW